MDKMKEWQKITLAIIITAILFIAAIKLDDYYKVNHISWLSKQGIITVIIGLIIITSTFSFFEKKLLKKYIVSSDKNVATEKLEDKNSVKESNTSNLQLEQTSAENNVDEDEIIRKLEKLAELKDKKIISEDEFASKKSNLLDKF